jgi:hypothetical protein
MTYSVIEKEIEKRRALNIPPHSLLSSKNLSLEAVPKLQFLEQLPWI